MGRIIKKTIKILVGGFCALVLVLQIPKVNSWIVESLFNLWLPQSYRISVDKITGTFPFEIKIKKITIHDIQGRWLKLYGTQYSWRGVDLLFKKINFDHLTVDSVKFYRVPESSSSDPISIPDHFPKVNIRNIKIKNLSILGMVRTSINADFQTKKTDHHQLSLKICLPKNQEKILEIHGDLIKDKLSLRFSIDQKVEEISGLFPLLHEHFPQGNISSHFEFYSNRKLQDISGYFTGHVTGLQANHPFITEVIGNELQWGINANFKPDEKIYRLVGKVTSSQGIRAQWDTQISPEKQQLVGQTLLHIPKIDQFNFLGKSYGGDLNVTADIQNNVLNWSLSGLTYLGKSIAASTGQIRFLSLTPTLALDFHGNLRGPGIAPHISGKWQSHDQEWHLEKTHIKDSLFDIQLDVAKDTTLSGQLEATFDDLSALKPITGLDLSGRSYLKCHGSKGEGTYDASWSTPEIQGKITGNMNYISPQETSHITVKELSIHHRQQSLLALQKPWAFQWSKGELHSGPGLLSIGRGQLIFKECQIAHHLAGEVHLKDIPLTLLNLFMVESSVQGHLNGSMSISGTRDNPELLGRLHLNQISLPDENRKNTKYFDSDLTFKRHQSTYQVTVNYKDTLKSQIKGEAIITSQKLWPELNDPFEASLQGSYNLSILNGFLTNGDRLKGIVQVSSKSTGTLAHPTLSGQITMKDGMYENGELGLLIQKITLKGQLHKDELIIENVEGKDVAQGNVKGSGSIQWAEGLQNPLIRINMAIHNMIIANSDLLLIRGGGNIKIDHSINNQLTIGGQLSINSADAFLADTAPKTRLLKIRNVETLTKEHPATRMILTKEKSPPFGQLNLHIDIPQNMFIRGYGINSQWHGKLNLTGPINSPQIGGSITLQRGQIDIIGKTLQLTKGQIKFIPEEGPIDPILKIVATKSVNDVKAMIKVEGRSSRPEINFASHPILPQEEVVSLILFGKSLNSVTAAQSLKLATAIASIKSSSRDQSITEQFRTAFGLDEIGIQGEDSSDDNNRELTSGYSFHVGKQLTDRAYIAVKQGLTGEASTDVILRYDLTEQAKAELETGTGRDAGAAGLSWEKRY